MTKFIVLAAIVAAVVSSAGTPTSPRPVAGHESIDWPVYRGDPKGNQYVAMAQIHAANVHRLQPAWEYHTRDANQRSTMHANPIVVNGVMYVTTPALKAVALDAVNGSFISSGTESTRWTRNRER
jgi:quinoprotein glucose dehydrogenase